MELIYLPNELRDIILLPKYYQNENLTLNEKVEICHNSQFMTNVISQLKYLNIFAIKRTIIGVSIQKECFTSTRCAKTTRNN